MKPKNEFPLGAILAFQVSFSEIKTKSVKKQKTERKINYIYFIAQEVFETEQKEVKVSSVQSSTTKQTSCAASTGRSGDAGAGRAQLSERLRG